MNTLKTIYEKLSDKTELAKHKVELNNIQILNDSAAKIQTHVDNANRLAYTLGEATTLWNKSFTKIKTEIDIAEKEIINAYKTISQVQQQGKELGIDKIPVADKVAGYLRGYAKTVSAIRGSIMDNKNRMNTNF